jgi:hypothetical protein
MERRITVQTIQAQTLPRDGARKAATPAVAPDDVVRKAVAIGHLKTARRILGGNV